MNYNYLRYFSVLAELEHYTLAAARLEITQPSLSSAIRNLENELGVKLFEKTGRNIRLTEQGRYYYKKVSSALENLDAAEEILRRGVEAAPIILRIGVVSGTVEGLLEEQMRVYLAKEPRACFQITEGSDEELIDYLHRERVDMALLTSSVRDRTLHFRKVGRRRNVVAVPSAHPLAKHDKLSADELLQWPQIGYNYNSGRSFEAWAGQKLHRGGVVCQTNTLQSALELVRFGFGFAIVPEPPKCPDGVKCIPLNENTQSLYLCTLYDKWLDPPLWEFAQRLAAEGKRRLFAEPR